MGAVRLLKSFLRLLANPFQRRFLVMLLIINLLGSLYGFYWYRYQLVETKWYYLPFVPDSPLSSSLFTLALLLILLEKRNSLLELLAYLWVIKYGLWAVIINLNYGYLNPAGFGFENWMLTFSHLGMAVEGFLFLRHLKFPKVQLWMMILWLAINDFVDYSLGQHPWLFDERQLSLAGSSAVVLSLLVVVISFFYLNQKKYAIG